MNVNGNIKINDIRFSTPIKINELENLENELKFQFPKELRDIYILQASDIQFRWQTEQSVFGTNCNKGEFYLLSPFSILEQYKDMIDIAEEIKGNAESENDEGVMAINNDWIHWVPIIQFSNGDAFCIDKRNFEIVFFEHDVIDGGPNLHGIKIANCYKELISKWSALAFVDIYHWDEVCDEDGIDINNEQFKHIREFMQG